MTRTPAPAPLPTPTPTPLPAPLPEPRYDLLTKLAGGARIRVTTGTGVPSQAIIYSGVYNTATLYPLPLPIFRRLLADAHIIGERSWDEAFAHVTEYRISMTGLAIVRSGPMSQSEQAALTASQQAMATMGTEHTTAAMQRSETMVEFAHDYAYRLVKWLLSTTDVVILCEREDESMSPMTDDDITRYMDTFDDMTGGGE